MQAARVVFVADGRARGAPTYRLSVADAGSEVALAAPDIVWRTSGTLTTDALTLPERARVSDDASPGSARAARRPSAAASPAASRSTGTAT